MKRKLKLEIGLSGKPTDIEIFDRIREIYCGRENVFKEKGNDNVAYVSFYKRNR